MGFHYWAFLNFFTLGGKLGLGFGPCVLVNLWRLPRMVSIFSLWLFGGWIEFGTWLTSWGHFPTGANPFQEKYSRLFNLEVWKPFH